MTPEQLDTLRVLLPALLAAITVIGGGIVYNWQKSIDRKNQIRAERRELYRKFLVIARAIQTALLADSTEEEFVELYARLDGVLAELLVCAPDDVVDACEELGPSLVDTIQVKIGSEDGIFRDQFANASRIFDRVVLAMRKDVFGDTESTTGTIDKMLDGLDDLGGSISKSSKVSKRYIELIDKHYP